MTKKDSQSRPGRKRKIAKDESDDGAKTKKRRKKKHEELQPEEVPQEFLNRDLAWIEFNARVLNEALDERTPVLERVRFLGIFTSNLDEFFMKRVGGLKHQVELGVQRKSGGLTPLQQLAAIRSRVLELSKSKAECYEKVILPQLAANGIQIVSWAQLSESERESATQYFRQNVFPVLTPLAVDPGLPFPFISNLSTSLGVTLRHPEREEKLFARIKVPKIFPQWVQVQGDVLNDAPVFRFVGLMDLIRNNLKGLFPDMEILDVMPFRITRNAEIERDEDEADDLLEMITEELKQRRFGDVVRLEHGPNPDPWMTQFLMEELELTEAEVYEVPALLDYTDLKPIVDLAVPGLKYDTWTPVVPPKLIDEQVNIFSTIREGDILVHHPYESFTQSVERFIRQAVDDPKVLAIKMTLYRTGDESPFIPLLTRAAERGKQVVVLIELKARFDEERNIHWAQQLENSGVHVVYGVVGLKTHAKVMLVIRRNRQLP
jgi:polyphosphate kinase